LPKIVDSQAHWAVPGYPLSCWGGLAQSDDGDCPGK
jgi:hypothetical protein